MEVGEELGAAVEVEATRFGPGGAEPAVLAVPTEVPLTVVANGVEVATLMCTPADLEAMALGFLFSAGLIRSGAEVEGCRVDPVRWVAECQLGRTPDLELLEKRVYTAGCGKGVMYANVMELAGRRPLHSDLRVDAARLDALGHALQGASPQYRRTRGIHTAALCPDGQPPPRWFDDVGRHNAVDKAIGDALQRGTPMERCVLVTSGRTSSEILQKTRLAGIPVCASRSVPTHQSVLRAREMGVTLVGQLKGKGFVVYAHTERVAAPGGV